MISKQPDTDELPKQNLVPNDAILFSNMHFICTSYIFWQSTTYPPPGKLQSVYIGATFVAVKVDESVPLDKVQELNYVENVSQLVFA